MRDDKEFNIKFVKCVKGYSCLYDNTPYDYSKRIKIDEAWDKVATEMHDTVKCCKERWKTIRNDFARRMKNPFVDRCGKKYKKAFELAEFMQFLIPYMDIMRGNKRSISIPGGDEYRSKINQNESDETDESQELAKGSDTLRKRIISTETELGYNIQSCNIQSCNAAVQEDESISGCSEPFEYYPGISRVAVSDKHFLLSLMPDIDQMSMRQKRIFKLHVIQIIDGILDDEGISYSNGGTPHPDNVKFKIQAD